MSRRALCLFAVLPLFAGCDREKKTVIRYDVAKAPPSAAPAKDIPPSSQPDAEPASPETKKPAPAAAANDAVRPADLETPGWSPPASWRALPEAPMRKGSWEAGPADAPALITVTVFPGDVGGMPANVGRWCAQIGLPPPKSEEEFKKTASPAKVGGLDAIRVTLVNGDKALTAVTVSREGASWFFKISGGALAVSGANVDFEKFLGSVKWRASGK